MMMSESCVQEWGGYAFTWVCIIQPDVDPQGQLLRFRPQARYARASSSRLNKHGSGPFCHFSIPATIREEGVYIIARGDQPMYVGLCDNLSARFNAGYGNISPKHCYEGGQPTNCKVNTKILQEALFGNMLQLWFFRTVNKTLVEQQLIQQIKPPWNGRQS